MEETNTYGCFANEKNIVASRSFGAKLGALQMMLEVND